MSSPSNSPGTSALDVSRKEKREQKDKPEKRKGERKKEKGAEEKKKDGEKHDREEEKEKDRERREKERREREDRDRERREEKREKERERRERERDEKEQKERERRAKKDAERLARERRLHRPSIATLADDADMEDDYRPSFAARLFHTFTHLVFISLLLLTIGSLAMGTSTLFATSALELVGLFRQGLANTSHQELALALLCFLLFLFTLAFTLLSALMLIPALWVSLLEIIVCPWSIISDYFLP